MPIDPSATIAPTAKVHPDAIVGPQCVIGEYCIVEQDVALGRGNRLEPYVYLKRWTSMGDENAISACTALGTDPFDKSFTGDRSTATSSAKTTPSHEVRSANRRPFSATTTTSCPAVTWRTTRVWAMAAPLPVVLSSPDTSPSKIAPS
jgi:hypothetical protein